MKPDEAAAESAAIRLRCIRLITEFDEETVHAVESMLTRMVAAPVKQRKRGPRGDRVATPAVRETAT
jgi:hypothetical protein